MDEQSRRAVRQLAGQRCEYRQREQADSPQWTARGHIISTVHSVCDSTISDFCIEACHEGGL
jgi:hypothetical protein